MKTKIALIPSYKPNDKLIYLVKELSKNNFEIIVIDDGSGVEFKNVFTKIEKIAKVISYKVNQGKGHALKTGLKYIKDNYFDDYVVVTLDCDGQHTIKDTIKVTDEAQNNKNTLIVGKRPRDKKIPLRSKIGNEVTRFVFRTITGIDIYDTQSGLRAFSNKLTELLLNTEGNRYEYEMNVLLKCCNYNINIKEIEISTIYIDNNSNSHFNPIKDSIRIYKEIFIYKKTLKKKKEENYVK